MTATSTTVDLIVAFLSLLKAMLDRTSVANTHSIPEIKCDRDESPPFVAVCGQYRNINTPCLRPIFLSENSERPSPFSVLYNTALCQDNGLQSMKKKP